MSTCTEPAIQQQLYRFVRRELESDEAHGRVEEHLATCGVCRGIVSELGWMLGSMRPTSSAEQHELMNELRRVADLEPRPASGDPVDDSDPKGLLGRLKRWLSSGGGR